MAETNFKVSFNEDQLRDISFLIEDVKQEMRRYWLAEQNRAEMRLKILGTILPHSENVLNDCKKYEAWIFGESIEDQPATGTFVKLNDGTFVKLNDGRPKKVE